MESTKLGLILDGDNIVSATDMQDALSALQIDICKLLGSLTNLNTIDKSNLVNAINESRNKIIEDYDEIRTIIDSISSEGNANIFTSEVVPSELQYLLFKIKSIGTFIEDDLTSDVVNALITHKDGFGNLKQIMPYTKSENVLVDSSTKKRLSTKLNDLDLEITSLNTRLLEISTSINSVQDKVILLKGTSTFNSIVGKVITHALNKTDYTVSITPTGNPNGTLGEVWVVNAENSFTVYCSGTNTSTPFTYIVV